MNTADTCFFRFCKTARSVATIQSLLGAAVCAGIRAPMGALRKTAGFVLAHGRNGRVCPAAGIIWKLSFGRNLYMLVMPKGARYWRYCYRYGGKRKTLALGTYPDVPIARARSRHRAARQLLAAGVDPSLKRSELRRFG